MIFYPSQKNINSLVKFIVRILADTGPRDISSLEGQFELSRSQRFLEIIISRPNLLWSQMRIDLRSPYIRMAYLGLDCVERNMPHQSVDYMGVAQGMRRDPLELFAVLTNAINILDFGLLR